MTTSIYRWDGKYFGFIRNDRLFEADGEYLGWVDDDGKVWRSDGTFLGERVEENYILRRTTMVEPVPKVPKVPPVPPVPSVPKVDRVGRVKKIGWKDVLEEL